jgi:prepilin-type N-terminal cleavage/methylation domain-containing protein
MRLRRPAAFTLIELLVVILIIAVVSAVTLPTVLPALQHRQVSESARVLQAAIEGARDQAVRANAPRGIRLLPDPSFLPPMLAANRIVAIEPAGEYTEGRVAIRAVATPAHVVDGVTTDRALRIEECQVGATGLPNPRTSWYWNARVGDRMRIGSSGRTYTVVGPIVVGNPEKFVNVGEPGAPVTGANETVNGSGSEYLFLVNGQDDDQDGFIDDGFDGLRNDGTTGIPDLAAEWEPEAWLAGEDATETLPDGTTRPRTFDAPYTILRRPYPTPGVRPTDLPSNIVIDLTTLDPANPTRERSRLPVEPGSGYVDIMILPNGTVAPRAFYATLPSTDTTPFLHCWVAERADVFPPEGTGATRLPMPEGTPGYTGSRYLTGERRLVTINMKTGNVTTSEVEEFDGTDPARPFYAAQMGTRDAR